MSHCIASTDVHALKPAWEARLNLHYLRAGARTVLHRKEHSGPLVVQKALYPDGDAVCDTLIVHPPGCIAGGDPLAISVALDAGAEVLFTTPGATRWYRSTGAVARQHVRLCVATDGEDVDQRAGDTADARVEHGVDHRIAGAAAGQRAVEAAAGGVEDGESGWVRASI